MVPECVISLYSSSKLHGKFTAPQPNAFYQYQTIACVFQTGFLDGEI